MARRYVVLALLAFALGVTVFLHTLLYSDGWSQRQRARSDFAALEASNESAEQRVEQLRSKIEALRSRPDVQERAVRHELGYVRPEHEIVLELGER